MTESDRRSIPENVHEAAADWLQKRDRGVDAATEAKFRQWRSANADHRRAYDQLEETWLAGAGLGETGLGRERTLEAAPFLLRRTTHLGAAALASVAGLGIGLALLPSGWRPDSIIATVQAQSFETAVGEIRTVALSDGSRITLDTDSKVEVSVSPSSRSATLDRGRARFVIADHRTAPFVIHVRTDTITADKAIVDASSEGGVVRVHVLNGDAKLSNRPGEAVTEPPATLGAGQATTMSASAPVIQGNVAEDAWPNGMISLNATPVAAAIGAINRYNRIQLRLDAPESAARTVSGAFRARDPEGFAQAVAALRGLRVSKPAPNLIVLTTRN